MKFIYVLLTLLITTNANAFIAHHSTYSTSEDDTIASNQFVKGSNGYIICAEPHEIYCEDDDIVYDMDEKGNYIDEDGRIVRKPVSPTFEQHLKKRYPNAKLIGISYQGNQYGDTVIIYFKQ